MSGRHSIEFNTSLLMMGVSALALVGAWIAFYLFTAQERALIQEQRVALARQARESDAAREAEQLALTEQLEVLASAKPFEPRPGLSAEAFGALELKPLATLLVYEALPTEETRLGVDYPEDQLLEAPQGHELAGIFTRRLLTPHPIYSADLDTLLDALFRESLFSGPVPSACGDPDLPGVWLHFSFTCRRYRFDTLSELRSGHALYRDEAMLDPEGLAPILEALTSFAPDETFFGPHRTTRQLYHQLGGAVPHYLAAYDEVHEGGEGRLLEVYRKTLKRERREHGEDAYMVPHYNALTRKEGFTSPPFLIGFWLRRLDDGTATMIHDALMRLEERYGPYDEE